MSNRLGEETSPYLKQHAANPVHWQAWGDEALDEARKSGKPILLSVGYSACHWCHVMAHESFEDEATARLMNDLYVNIKVDREERPDLDKIYQTSHQLLTRQSGGWPLTVFLTPEQVPIFTGTYFPKERRYGMPAFREVLVAIDQYYREKADEIHERGTSLVEALGNLQVASADDFATLTHAPLAAARERFNATYDSEHGGFGGGPKFPHSTSLELLLEHSYRAGGADARASTMVTHTLDCMAQRGLYDHLAGGFFRYSVDGAWAIPHFEKMLYDNAQLLRLYADAYAATGTPQYANVARATAHWIMRDMQSPQGGYYSTLDADSEHEEGKFYVWTPAEFDAVLAPDESALAKRVLGLTSPPNFEGKHWHLTRAEAPEAAAAALGLDAARAGELFEAARAKLLAARERRVWPGRDEKLLVSWNGLMIAGMARAARVLADPELAESAARAVDFIRAELWRDGRLKATYKDGRARFAAYLDDYAFLAYGLLELNQSRWRDGDLQFARELADVLLTHFEDELGGFFFTADDHERLIHKPKPFADEAVPAGNGIAALALIALGHLLGEQRYLDAAERTVRAAAHTIESYPDAHATLLRALHELLEPPKLVVLRGTPEELVPWQRKLASAYEPHRLAFAIPNDAKLTGLLAQRTPRERAVGYVCEGMTCRAPVELADGVAL
ncbi:MAG TPA: thioredoxin domain-containing protein [Gammaproteobacteria bacterium]|nr:thioredoxin domain-containing protein [Gammaproteobacteria bacterium]